MEWKESMAESGKHSANRKCTQCGADLPGNLPDELCPKCLLKAAMGTQPVLGPTGTVALPSPDTKFRGLPQPGEELGHYRIVRVLGRGGMGAAFEAEDLETGRRVALKVLSHTLDAPDARERFFREGRLAAYRHTGYWQNMDTLNDKHLLEAVWAKGNAPWQVWKDGVAPAASPRGFTVHEGGVR